MVPRRERLLRGKRFQERRILGERLAPSLHTVAMQLEK
jgi:hypothetical protein